MLINKKINLLAIKKQALEEEIQACREIITHAAAEVDERFRDRHPELFKTKNKETKQITEKHNKQRQQEQEKVNISQSVSKESKEVYRKIVLKTHPDRLLDEVSPSEREEKIKLYQKAVKAQEEDDIIMLCFIADKLGVPLPKVSKQDIKKTENKIAKMQAEIKNLEETVIWQWFIAEGKHKENILERLMILMYEQTTKDNTSA